MDLAAQDRWSQGQANLYLGIVDESSAEPQAESELAVAVGFEPAEGCPSRALAFCGQHQLFDPRPHRVVWES